MHATISSPKPATARRTLDYSALLGFGLLAALLVVNAGLGYRNTRQLNEDARGVAHTHEVLDLSGDTLGALADAETGMRGFVITGKDEFLQSYEATIATFGSLLRKLKDETKDNPGQQARLQKLEQMAAVKFAFLQEVIALRRQSAEEAAALIAAGKGKAQMDAIRRLVQEMEQVETDLLRDRQRASARAYDVAVTTGLLAAVLGLLMVGAVVLLLQRSQRTGKALRESDERMRLATAATGVGIWEWNVLTHRIRWDAEMFRMYGVAPTPDGFVTYETWSGAVLPEDLAVNEAVLQETVRRCGRSTRIFRIRRGNDGEVRDLEAVETVRTNAQGQAEWVVGTNLDITEQKRTAQALRDLNATLEERVRQRTAELEASNKELEAFSYSVSHDLRAPLRAVNGFAGIVLEDYGAQLPEEGRGYLQRVRNGSQQMGRLIDDLLAFSRLSRLSLKRQPMDCTRMVEETWEELKPQREGRQVDLRLGELPTCSGDPVLVKQIWVNLLSNAIKYTRDRTPAVVEVGGANKNGRPVYFVRDNGVGFDMQYANKLFGVFQRLHRADEFEGTGVGLAIVQRIVHRHGGQVWAEAKVDGGATFSFTLETETKL